MSGIIIDPYNPSQKIIDSPIESEVPTKEETLEIGKKIAELKEELKRQKVDEVIEGPLTTEELEEMFGYKLPRAVGFQIVLKLMECSDKILKSDGSESIIATSEQFKSMEESKLYTGMLVSIGPLFYWKRYGFILNTLRILSKVLGRKIRKALKIEKLDLNLGEFYVINRYDGLPFLYKGVKFIYMTYQHPGCEIEDAKSVRKI